MKRVEQAWSHWAAAGRHLRAGGVTGGDAQTQRLDVARCCRGKASDSEQLLGLEWGGVRMGVPGRECGDEMSDGIEVSAEKATLG